MSTTPSNVPAPSAAAAATPGAASVAVPTRREGYIDWMRGLAVVVMIFAHAVDSWVRPDQRQSQAYFWFLVVAGMGAPMFLWLAGLSVPLAGHARMRRGATLAEASRRLQVRGWQIFGLAMLFRLQAYVFSPGATLAGIFKVDILNVMGVSLVTAAWLWGRSRSSLARIVWAGAATVAVVVLSAPLRAWEWPALLPDPIEHYLRPQPGRTTFTLFPWMAFVPAGLMVGELLAVARAAATGGTIATAFERAAATLRGLRLHLLLLATGLAVGVAAYWLSFRPTLVPGSQFWTTSPAFFFMRMGALVAVLGLLYVVVHERSPWQRATWPRSWSPMEQLGRTSLFVYWIHVELAYGIFSRPLHKSLSFGGALAASTLFTLGLLGISIAKTRLWDRKTVTGARR